MAKTTLLDVCDELSDGLHKAPVFSDDGEYLFVNALNLSDGFIIDTGNEKRSSVDEWRKYGIELNERTILYSIDGTIGNMARYRGEKCILGKGACYIMLNDTVDVDYMYYLLQSEHFRGYLRSMQTGSTIHHISLETMREYPLPPMPPLDMQRFVGGLLASIDEKIANNKMLITELEGTARLIYDYWFSQFDFPNEDGKPYRSSGGKMIWSKKLKREIPANWEEGMLSTICHYSENSVAADALNANTYVSLDNMISNYGGITPSEYCPTTGNCKAYSMGDTLFGNIRPYFKKVYFASQNGGCSPDVLVLRPAEGASCFVYETIARDSFVDYVTAGAKGTKMPRGDKDHIMHFKMGIPPQSVIYAFENAISPIQEYKSYLAAESEELARLRDWLLPMLMNGQATITG